MLGNNPYNFKTIEKITAAFGWIFQDISIERKHPTSGVVKTIKVPLELSSKEKWAQRLNADPDAGDEAKQKHVQIILPRMGYEMTGFRYDASRKLNSILYRVAVVDEDPDTHLVSNKVVKRQLNPVPMIFNFALYLQTRTLEDGYAILEQFIPFFQPDFTVPILDVPDINLRRDIIFSLVNNTHQDSYEGNFLDKRTIEWQFDFEARGHIYPPIREKKVITEADITVHDPDATIRIAIDPPDALQTSEFTVKTPENIYYIDPVNGADTNSGRSETLAWKSTELGDTVHLQGLDKVMYKSNGTWVLYRVTNLQLSDWEIPLNLVTLPLSNL